MNSNWYPITNAETIPTPALLVYPDRVEENIRRMLALAGSTDRLRPHVKTHKLPQVVRLQLNAGITRFKCSTLAEAEMAAAAGAPDVLLAFPQLGPNAQRLARLVAAFPQTRFATVTDDLPSLERLSATMQQAGCQIDVLLDIDNGMHRTGIAPGSEAVALYQAIGNLPAVRPAGLHIYDGHVRDRNLEERIAHGEREFAPVTALVEQLRAAGLEVPQLVCGGTPTFPVHARHADRQPSPGTCLFWDASYAGKFPDLEFVFAALLLGRVVSKPGPNRLCLDLGYKSVAPDNPDVRVELLDLPDAQVINHSEEHLAVETSRAGQYGVGDVVYGVPFHVCPTVALHREAVVVRNQQAVERWPIVARDRMITI